MFDGALSQLAMILGRDQRAPEAGATVPGTMPDDWYTRPVEVVGGPGGGMNSTGSSLRSMEFGAASPIPGYVMPASDDGTFYGASAGHTSAGAGEAAQGRLRAADDVSWSKPQPVPTPEQPGFFGALSARWDKLGPLEKMLVMTQLASLAGGVMGARKGSGGPPPSRIPGSWNAAGPQVAVSRQSAPAGGGDWYTYGQRPQSMQWQGGVRKMAAGGLAQAAGEAPEAMEAPEARAPGPGPVEGPGSGRDDLIPAQLSDGEYVFDAETVALLGDGSSDEGARRLDEFRAKIRAQKGRALAQGRISPDAQDPMSYLGSE